MPCNARPTPADWEQQRPAYHLPGQGALLVQLLHPLPTDAEQLVAVGLQLREDLSPTRSHVTYDEALRVAELQANKLSELLRCRAQDIAESEIARLPRIMVTYEDLPVSGTSHWNGHTWV